MTNSEKYHARNEVMYWIKFYAQRGLNVAEIKNDSIICHQIVDAIEIVLARNKG